MVSSRRAQLQLPKLNVQLVPTRENPDGAVLRAVTIVHGSTVRCVQSDQGNAMPLVNASPERRVILRMMRRERSRGSQITRVLTNRSR